MNRLFFSTLIVVTLTFITAIYTCTPGQNRALNDYKNKKTQFNNVVLFIKRHKLQGTYYIDGRFLSNLGNGDASGLDSMIREIGIETNIQIDNNSDTGYRVSFQILAAGEYYLIYLDDTIKNNSEYKKDFENSRMKIQTIDKNWVLYIEYPSIGKWN